MSFADSLGPSTNLLIIDMMTDDLARTRLQVQDELIRIKDRLNAVSYDHARKVDTGIESITYWCELLQRMVSSRKCLLNLQPTRSTRISWCQMTMKD